MPIFRVRCSDEAGSWDKVEREGVEALDEHAAAEQVVGIPLIERGKRGQLRAEVWLPAKPGQKKLFYVPPEPR